MSWLTCFADSAAAAGPAAAAAVPLTGGVPEDERVGGAACVPGAARPADEDRGSGAAGECACSSVVVEPAAIERFFTSAELCFERNNVDKTL